MNLLFKVSLALSITLFHLSFAVVDRQNLKETARILVETSINIRKSFKDVSDVIKSLSSSSLLPDIAQVVNSDQNVTRFRVRKLKIFFFFQRNTF